jgi:glycosyltransferase 2 family protein
LLAIVLFVVLLRQQGQGWADIVAAASQIPWWRFLLAFILVMVSRFAVSGRWHVLMYSAGTGITPRQSIRLTFTMLFTSNFLPTTIGGDVVRYAGAVRLGFDNATSLASLVVDRLVGMTGMAMALPFGIPGYLHYLSPSPSTQALTLAWVQPLAARGRRFFHEILDALKLWLNKPRSLAASLGFTWVHMLCTFATVSVLLTGMGEKIPFWMIMGLWSATYFVTLLPVSINGMGVQELAITFFYVSVGGISPASGITLALIMRALQMIASLPGALFIPDIIAGQR